MKLNKKVIDSITVCGLCAMLTVTAVTNSGRSEVKAEDKVLANTGLEHTGYNSYAGVAATLFDYEKGLTAENAVTVEKENGGSSTGCTAGGTATAHTGAAGMADKAYAKS